MILSLHNFVFDWLIDWFVWEGKFKKTSELNIIIIRLYTYTNICKAPLRQDQSADKSKTNETFFLEIDKSYRQDYSSSIL